MTIVRKLSSFPNSRIKPRSATSAAFTRNVDVCGNNEAAGTNMPDGSIVTANGNILILDANENRTKTLLRNISETSRMFFAYEDKPQMIDGTLDDGGFFLEIGEAVDIETKEAIFARMESSGIASRGKAYIEYGEG